MGRWDYVPVTAATIAAGRQAGTHPPLHGRTRVHRTPGFSCASKEARKGVSPMGKFWSGLFVYPAAGRIHAAIGLTMDGQWLLKHSLTPATAPALDAGAYTLMCVRDAIAATGKARRSDVVSFAGLDLPADDGKAKRGYASVRELIVRRCGEDADRLIGILEGEVDLDIAA